MTQEEFVKAVQNITDKFWNSTYRPPNLLNTEHNASTLAQQMFVFYQNWKRLPNVQEVRALVDYCGDMDNGGSLQYHHAQAAPPSPPAQPNPTDNLPDADEPLLKGLRCLEDIAEKGETISRKIMQLGGHGVGGSRNPLLDKLNHRLAYIQTHRIERADLPQDQPTETKPTGQVVITRPLSKFESNHAPEIAELRKKIDIATRGYTNWAAKQRERLHAQLTELAANPSNARYRVSSRGGVEWITGIEAVERIIHDAIRDSDNPIR